MKKAEYSNSVDLDEVGDLDLEGGMWDVIVLIPDHCLSVYFGGGNNSFSFNPFLLGNL